MTGTIPGAKETEKNYITTISTQKELMIDLETAGNKHSVECKLRTELTLGKLFTYHLGGTGLYP